jgi:trans-aconitate methyltransferase
MPSDTSPARSGTPTSRHAGALHDDESVFGAQWWERHYQHDDAASVNGPSPYVTDEFVAATPGTALDAGCGTGASAIWLARRGWNVTAVDISSTAIAKAHAQAAHETPDVAHRIRWTAADLTSWEPPERYDLVVSQYVHPDMPFGRFVTRLTGAVAPGGTLIVVGHDRADHRSASHAPRDATIGADEISGLLDARHWKIDIAETRPRQVMHHASHQSIMDTVIEAHRI